MKKINVISVADALNTGKQVMYESIEEIRENEENLWKDALEILQHMFANDKCVIGYIKHVLSKPDKQVFGAVYRTDKYEIID